MVKQAIQLEKSTGQVPARRNHGVKTHRVVNDRPSECNRILDMTGMTTIVDSLSNSTGLKILRPPSTRGRPAELALVLLLSRHRKLLKARGFHPNRSFAGKSHFLLRSYPFDIRPSLSICPPADRQPKCSPALVKMILNRALLLDAISTQLSRALIPALCLAPKAQICSEPW